MSVLVSLILEGMCHAFDFHERFVVFRRRYLYVVRQSTALSMLVTSHFYCGSKVFPLAAVRSASVDVIARVCIATLYITRSFFE